MTNKTIAKSLEIRRKGGITREGQTLFVPSSNGEAVYTVTGHACSCPAMGSRTCSHLWATTYLDALLAIQLMRFADDDDFLAAVVEEYRARVEILPGKIRQIVREEWSAARERINHHHQKAA
jgi:hypothetical protein